MFGNSGRAGHRIFLDLKFHDIPNTVAKAGVEAARLGVWMFNVHAAGGNEMMKRVVYEVGEVCAKESLSKPLIIGATVLTSSSGDALLETGIEEPVGQHALRLARLARNAGLDGVVASAQEAKMLHREFGDRFTLVTPGIRRKWHKRRSRACNDTSGRDPSGVELPRRRPPRDRRRR